MFQYEDSTEPSIYSLSEEYLLQEMTSSRGSKKHVAIGLMDYLTGMAYIGKFQEAILDALFGLQDIDDLLQLHGMYYRILHPKLIYYSPTLKKGVGLRLANQS